MIPRVYLIAGIAALSLTIGTVTGWTVNGWRYEAAIAASDEALRAETEKAQAAERDIIRHRANAILLAQELEVERNREAEIITVEVERETVRYLQSDASNDCGIDRDGVRLVNKSSEAFRMRQGGAGPTATTPTMHCPGPATGSSDYLRRGGRVGYPDECPVSAMLQPPSISSGLGAFGAFG